MLGEIFFRFENARALFRCDVEQAARAFDFIFVRLELGHALHAVGSPGSSQELQHHGTGRDHRGEGKFLAPIGCRECEIRRAIADVEGLRGTRHPFANVSQASEPDNTGKNGRTTLGT